MLTSIRTTFSRGIARFILAGLMLLLIASFGLWGIQDVFRGFHSNTVADVGSTGITTEQFQRTFNREVQQLSQRAGTPITAQQARAFGLDQQILNRMVGDAALDETARTYGLALAPTQIASMVMTDPNFQDPATGRFDRGNFAQALRQNGISEQRFFADQQNVYRRAELGEALAGQAAVPATLAEAMARYQAETRGIAYVTVTSDTVGATPAPDAAALKTYYDEHKGDFRAPEYRKIAYVALEPATVAKAVTVGDDDVQKTYDARKDSLGTPEKRTIQRIAFPDAASAKAAAEKIASGASFDQIATERGLKPEDLDLGSVTRAEVLDPALADAAFKLQQGATSGVVQGRLQIAILKVTAIQPATMPTFEASRDQIRRDLATERAHQQILDLESKIEDQRAGGATLGEIAPKFGLKMQEIVAIDAQGQDAAGQPYTLPLKDQLVKAAFASEPGADNEVLDGRDQGFVWYDVQGVTPARDRTLDEAKAQVTMAWTDEQTTKRVQQRAEAMLKELDGGKTLDAVAQAGSLEVKQAWSLKRNEAAQGLSTAAISRIFATAKDANGTALVGDGADRIVFKVTDDTVPPFEAGSDAAKALDRQTSAQRSQELLLAYIAQITDQLGAKVNRAALVQATGAAGDS